MNFTRSALAILPLLGHVAAFATDWPQYRGPTTDGISTEPMKTQWPVSGPSVVWRNSTATNGFSAPVVSQGRVFAMSLRANASDGYDEYCVAINATDGSTLWATAILIGNLLIKKCLPLVGTTRMAESAFSLTPTLSRGREREKNWRGGLRDLFMQPGAEQGSSALRA